MDVSPSNTYTYVSTADHTEAETSIITTYHTAAIDTAPFVDAIGGTLTSESFDNVARNAYDDNEYGETPVSEANTSSPTQLLPFMSSSLDLFSEDDHVVLPERTSGNRKRIAFASSAPVSVSHEGNEASNTAFVLPTRTNDVFGSDSAGESIFTSPESAFSDFDDAYQPHARWPSTTYQTAPLSAIDNLNFMHHEMLPVRLPRNMQEASAAPSAMMGNDFVQQQRYPLPQTHSTYDDLYRSPSHEPTIDFETEVEGSVLAIEDILDGGEHQQRRQQQVNTNPHRKSLSFIPRSSASSAAVAVHHNMGPSVFEPSVSVKPTIYERREASQVCKLNKIENKKTLWDFSMEELRLGGWNSCWSRLSRDNEGRKKRSAMQSAAGPASPKTSKRRKSNKGKGIATKHNSDDEIAATVMPAYVQQCDSEDSQQNASFTSTGTSVSSTVMRQFYEIKSQIQTIPDSSDPTRFQENGRCLIACEKCKKRKMRCTNEYPRCTNCIRRGTMCTYAERVRKRGRTKPMTPKIAADYAASMMFVDSHRMRQDRLPNNLMPAAQQERQEQPQPHQFDTIPTSVTSSTGFTP